MYVSSLTKLLNEKRKEWAFQVQRQLTSLVLETTLSMNGLSGDITNPWQT